MNANNQSRLYPEKQPPVVVTELRNLADTNVMAGLGHTLILNCAADCIERLMEGWDLGPPPKYLFPEETGWLVEENGPHWIALSDEPQSFTYSDRFGSQIKRVKDANEALRFARREDAEAFIAHFAKFLLNPVATEHQWPDDSK